MTTVLWIEDYSIDDMIDEEEIEMLNEFDYEDVYCKFSKCSDFELFVKGYLSFIDIEHCRNTGPIRNFTYKDEVVRGLNGICHREGSDIKQLSFDTVEDRNWFILSYL